jgi:MFS superfamily sulfate permease-like transporter
MFMHLSASGSAACMSPALSALLVHLLSAGLGLTNLAGACFSAYPATGSFARSAVASSAGARTPAHGFVTAALIGAVLLFATPVFGHLPLNALAAIVITGVLPLLDFGRAWALARVRAARFFPVPHLT